MIDPSRQLVLRVDLYANYIFLVAIIISLCEIPILMWRLEAGRYVFVMGWFVLLSLGIRRMWTAKIDHDLTSEAAIAGHGLVQIGLPYVAEAIKAKKLVPVLRNFPFEQQWMKMLVPNHRMHIARIQSLCAFIKDGCEKTPPWA